MTSKTTAVRTKLVIPWKNIIKDIEKHLREQQHKDTSLEQFFSPGMNVLIYENSIMGEIHHSHPTSTGPLVALCNSLFAAWIIQVMHK